MKRQWKNACVCTALLVGALVGIRLFAPCPVQGMWEGRGYYSYGIGGYTLPAFFRFQNGVVSTCQYVEDSTNLWVSSSFERTGRNTLVIPDYQYAWSSNSLDLVPSQPWNKRVRYGWLLMRVIEPDGDVVFRLHRPVPLFNKQPLLSAVTNEVAAAELLDQIAARRRARIAEEEIDEANNTPEDIRR